MARAKASVERVSGVPTFVIDGKSIGPMTYTTVNRDQRVIREIGKTGIRIFFLEERMKWNYPATDEHPDGTTRTLQDMREYLGSVPDAFFFLRVVLSPTSDWVNAHPGEQLVFNGGRRETVFSHLSGQMDGMWSFSSPAWQQEASQALLAYLDELKQHPEFDHVIGLFLCAGGTGEWYYPGKVRLHNEETGTYADFSEPFRRVYETILREKYGTQEELRRVWNDPHATFEQPYIPDMTDRRYLYEADRLAREALYKGSYVSLDPAKPDPASGRHPNVGTLMDGNTSMHTSDFFNAIHEATARAIVFFASVIKTYDPTLMVGAFYGYYGCTDYYDSSHTNGTLTILNSGKVDFLAGPCTYNNREPGGCSAQREMQDSFRLRNMLYFSEDDFRTSVGETSLSDDIWGVYNTRDSIQVLKREFARDLCEDIQGWWFDMTGTGRRSWYDDKDILALFARQQEISRQAFAKDRTRQNEIALIYDVESVHMVSDAMDRVVLDYYRTTDVPRFGGPVDYYFHNDLSNPAMPDYKLYIMLNTYCLSRKEREEAAAKARKNHAVVLWLYADGLYDPSAGTIMDVSHMEETTGMKIRLKQEIIYPYFHVDPASHPAVRYADRNRRYAGLDRDVHSNAWAGEVLTPQPYLYPGFAIDDDTVTVLGRYLSTGETAYALKERDGYTSVYAAVPVLRSELAASLAEYAGVHLFLKAENPDDPSAFNDILYANEHYVAVHASRPGRKTLHFKRPCDPFEVYEKRLYGIRVTSITFEMAFGETKMFCLDGAC